MSDDVSVRIENGVGRITLNRPDALHSLTMEMFRAIERAVTSWATDPRVLMVLVDHAAGSRGFCSGGDIGMFVDSGTCDPTEPRNLFRVEYSLNVAIDRFPKPYVSILDGITMGGGVGVTIHGSHRVATENTIFAMPETAIGLYPDIGSGYFLPRMEGQVGTWLGLTGARLKASDVVSIGVATDYVPAAASGDLKAALLSTDWNKASNENINSIIDQFSTPIGVPKYREHVDAINRCFAFDTVEEIIATLNREKTEWAAQQLTALQSKCPTSLKIALRMIREGARRKSIAEEMQTEFRIVWRRVNDTDLAEGVRSVVIDKNRLPQWNPATLEEVTNTIVESYFLPLGENELKV